MNVTSIYDPDYCKQLAQNAALHYVYDSRPGITRRRYGRGFAYYAPDGSHIQNRTIIKRIHALAIPPAYQQVWICPLPNGHLQATGRDGRRRKQYRYHPEWLTLRAQHKFDKLTRFADCLPSLREQLRRDIAARDTTSRRAVLAAMVTLLDETHMRIGNDHYAKTHQTYGLTTLRKKHSQIEGSQILLTFKGKNNTPWHIDLKDKKLARIIRHCEDIPGYELFKYLDEEGEKHQVDSSDVNAYLQELTGDYITAKNFRTWAACHRLFGLLLATPLPNSKKAQQQDYNALVKQVAKSLGHTATVCKNAYLAPQLHAAWEAGTLPKTLQRSPTPHLSDEEYSFSQWWQTVES